MPSLEELLTAAVGGDAVALDTFVARLLPEVRRLVHAQIERRLRRPGEAALARLSTGDVVQEVLIEVVRGLDRFEATNEDAFIGMLATLVEHRLTDQLRHHHAERRDVRRHGAVGAQTAGIADDRTPSHEAGRREHARIYAEALATLSDRERALLSLRLEDRLGFREIAERLAYPSDDAARKVLQTVQARLAVRLARRGFQPAEEGR